MDYTLLLKAPLFVNLSVEEIEDLFTATPLRVRKFGPDTMIAQSGEQVNNFMIIIRGKVKGEMVDYTGRVIKIEEVIAPGAPAAGCRSPRRLPPPPPPRSPG